MNNNGLYYHGGVNVNVNVNVNVDKDNNKKGLV